MTGRGRPAIGERLVIRVPAGLRARIDAYAEAHGIPVAEAARRLLDTATQ
jgi:hypothetical protein